MRSSTDALLTILQIMQPQKNLAWVHFTFTFIHLAYAFIQSDLQLLYLSEVAHLWSNLVAMHSLWILGGLEHSFVIIQYVTLSY